MDMSFAKPKQWLQCFENAASLSLNFKYFDKKPVHDKYGPEAETPGTSFCAHEGIRSLWMSADGK